LLSPLFPRSPIDVSDRLRPISGDTLDALPGWRVLHTPGHTAGHISFFRENDRTLLVGDAFCTCDQNSFFSVAQQKPELTGPPWYFTPDWNGARRSVENLAALQPTLIVPGHGRPMTGADISQKLDLMAQQFDRYAKPDHGKYVKQSEESAA
ncbi:MAG: MBL fold metallo-hydrolase, partial [Acidobacteriales bacterium]|nr:MBL fold metallo-hydrolase [Terriglobales bacterium]